MNRLNFIGLLPLAILSGAGNHPVRPIAPAPVNILFLTADDLNYNSVGYLNGIMGKEKHYQPAEKFCWEFVRTESDLASGLGIGRDPHRPFAGSAAETRQWGADLPKAARKIIEDEVIVHSMIPDLPGTRKETAEYYTSVYRCDQTIGAILKALDESGMAENTLVVFLSDNGMSFPQGLQGRSFLNLLMGKKQKGRDYVFTEFHRNFARDSFPMRAVQNQEYLEKGNRKIQEGPPETPREHR